ncbi:MAG: type II secretion system protein GspN [Thermodesulfobacteriota bacterium]
MVKTGLKIFGYMVYVFILVFVFAHLVFPGKKAAYFLSDYAKNNFNADITAKRADLKFPLKLVITDPVISYDKINNLNLARIELQPKILPLITGMASAKAKILGFEGETKIKASAGLINPKDNYSLYLETEDINLDILDKNINSDISFSGRTSGKFRIDVKDKKGDFSSVFDVKDFDLVSDLILAPLSAFEINRLEIKGGVISNKIRFEDSRIKSGAGLASFSGNLDLRYPFENTGTDLEGRFVPDIEFFSRRKEDPELSIIFSLLKNNKTIEYSIKGRLKNPSVRLN